MIRSIEVSSSALFAELSKREAVLELKEILIFSMKSIFNLSVGNRSRPVELIRRNHSLLLELSKSRFMPFLDQLTINLNENIGEAIKRADDPWIAGIWEELVDYIAQLFADYLPRELVENDIFAEVNSKIDSLPIEFSSLRAEMLPNPHFVAFKCRFVVNFMKLTQIILRNTKLPPQSCDKIFALVEDSLSLCREFNSRVVQRFVLWKKGYFSSQNSLPSLYIFEINVHLSQFFHHRKNFPASTESLDIIGEILSSFVEKLAMTESAHEELRDKKPGNFTNPELSREFREKNFVEKQTAAVLYFDTIIEHIAPYLSRLELESLPDLAIFDPLIPQLISYISRANLYQNSALRCVGCLDCRDCESRFARIKKSDTMENFLQHLVKLRLTRKP